MIILDDSQLNKKNTKNLLYILRKLRPLVFGISLCSCGSRGCNQNSEKVDINGKYENYYNDIKFILKNREHIGK